MYLPKNFTSNGQQKYRHAGVQWKHETKQKSFSLLLKNYYGFYTFFWLTRRKTQTNSNILNMKVYEYIWKISEYAQKPTKDPKYSILLYVYNSIFRL